MTLYGKFWSGKNSFMQDVISNKLNFTGRNIHSCFNFRSVKVKFRFIFFSGWVELYFFSPITIHILHYHNHYHNEKFLTLAHFSLIMNNKKTYNIRK